MEPPNTVHSMLTGYQRLITYAYDVFSLTRTMLHQFNSQKLCDAAVNSPCAITALVQSHVTDVVGIAFSNGEASIYDIRQDERLFRVRMDGGAIRALSFRTGEISEYP